MSSTLMQTDEMMRQAKAHHRAGRLGPAEEIYQQVLERSRNDAEARHMLGVIAYQVGRPDLAVARIQSALRLDPTNAVAYKNLSAAMKAAGRFSDAADIARRAIELGPLDGGSHANLGNALSQLGRLDEAMIAYRRAVQLRSDSPEDWSNLGGCLGDLGELDEAIAAHKRAIALAPELAEAHWNLALAMLAQGDFEGWKEYEWRWKFDGFTSIRRNFAQPLWDGKPLAGRRLLLHAEQGFGDTIQFIRYLPRVADRAGVGKIFLECQPQLIGLFRQFRQLEAIVPAGNALPAFDTHCPLLSLPLVTDDRLGTHPSDAPYLLGDADRVQSWQDRLRGSFDRFRVGIAWAGSAGHRSDHQRSLKLDQLRSLASVAGVAFFSLQVGRHETNATAIFPNLIDHTAHLADFSQTAALIANLDLVVCVDTAVAHLSAAMNKPTWILLAHVPDWRWMRGRDDSPWYPSVRLFRQIVPNDWDEPIRRVRDELSKIAENRTTAAASAV